MSRFLIVTAFRAFAFCLVALGPAQASTGIALIIANETYDNLRGARGAAAVLRTVERLEAAGFRVDLATDVSAGAMQAALSQLSRSLTEQPHERVVIVFAGHVLNASHGTWLMGTNASQPNVASVEGEGVRLATVLAIASQRQGGAVVAVADFGFPLSGGAGFSPGLPAENAVPQGVTLVRGGAPGITDFLRSLATPGVTIGSLAGRRSDIQIEGFNPPYLTFLPVGHEPVRDADRTAWGVALDADTVASYQAYLAEWPNGEYADQAQAALTRLLNTPERIETALGLSRDERRSIQRDLTILGYNPRGIDGIFGAGTRGAIGAWQGANNLTQTGYLNRDQVFSLAQQGAQRAAQLEAEARARQQAEERRDRAFWRDTGSGQDEVGLRAYLREFPDGIFSSVAQDRLDQIEADRRAAAQARDRAAWDIAVRADTVGSYNDYLGAFPNGAFADQARDRIAQLRGPAEPQIDEGRARATEDALQLPQFTRVIIEQRLESMGFEPGPADGQFDRQTRRAIRRYQRASELEVTGFLTQPIVARLLTEGVLDLFR
ncbi:MAG: peptidoglycan-binding protein [Rhodobacteraceae bacterium]|nr:peptidoglycan-binding protein [Paracoccaceae bacterium]